MIARLDLHFHMAVNPPMSLGVYARKFLRSTYPCVDADTPLVGQSPNGNNNDRLIRASIVN